MKKHTLIFLLLLSSGCRPQLHLGAESYRDTRNPVSISVPDLVLQEHGRVLHEMMAADIGMSMNRGDLGLVIERPTVLGIKHDDIGPPLSLLISEGAVVEPFTVWIFVDGDSPAGRSPEVVESRLRSIATKLFTYGATNVTFCCLLPLGYFAVLREFPEHESELKKAVLPVAASAAQADQ